MLALFNQDIRQFVSKTTAGRLGEANILANIAPQFGEEVEGRPYLRTAFNQKTMADIQNSLSPHSVSEVLTGAMFDILIGIATRHLEKNLLMGDGPKRSTKALAIRPATFMTGSPAPAAG
jgi:hypothetical protein